MNVFKDLKEDMNTSLNGNCENKKKLMNNEK